MIIVRIELHSAITLRVTEIARMRICNIGGTRTRGNYDVVTFRGRGANALDNGFVKRHGVVRNHPRLSKHVWNLVAKALACLEYNK